MILQLCSDLQLGFKKGIDCTDVKFSVKTVANYFAKHDGSVYAATLDIREALDSVSHFTLHSALPQADMPLPTENVNRCWYNKLFVTVCWNELPFCLLPCSLCCTSGLPNIFLHL